MTEAFYEKVSGAILAAVTLAFVPFLWRRGREWWNRPSERKLLADAIRQNTQEIHGIRHELQSIGKNFQTLSEHAIIAASIGRLALNESSTPRWECDEHGQCVWVNNALSTLFKMPKSDMLGTGWTQAIAPGHQAKVSEAFLRAYSKPDDYTYVHPYPIQIGNKIINVVARSVETVRKPDGGILRMFGTVTPIDTIHEGDYDLKLQESA
jgi:PAS domain-containing protein